MLLLKCLPFYHSSGFFPYCNVMKSDLDDGDSTNWFYQQIVLRNHRNTKSLKTEKKNRGIRKFSKIKVGSYQNGWQTFMDFVLTHFRCPGVYSTIRRLKIENTWLFPLCQNQTLFLMALLTNLTSWGVISAPPCYMALGGYFHYPLPMLAV